MIRATIAATMCVLVLAACNKNTSEMPAPAPATDATTVEAPAPAPPRAQNAPADGLVSGVITTGRGAIGKPATESDRERQWMAYSHSMWLIMPPVSVQANFTRARDFCLQNAALDCILIQGTANAGDVNAQQPPSAQLVVTLPHAQVAVFQKSLLAPLAGQTKSDVTVRQQSTQAENLTHQVTDIERRTAQLTNYRDRLMEIAARSNVKAEDLIELEEKISEIQSELDQLASSKLEINERVTRERLDITFASTVSMTEAARPVSQAWDQSFEVLGNSASTVLLLLVAIIPWIPVGLLIWLVVWLVQRARRRRRQEIVQTAVVATVPPASNG